MSTPSTPTLKSIAFGDLEREFATTRRVLERIPSEQFGWKPHEKSMTFGRLAMHVATLPQWMLDTIQKDELDLNSVKPMRTEPADRDDLLRTFDQIAAEVSKAMAKMDDAALGRTWTLRRGEQVLHTELKAMILRKWCVSHMIHHRAQLCVYLRLLNIPVPAVYFNSSDEPEWTFV